MDTTNFKTFCDNFPYAGDGIYGLIFRRNRDRIRTKRARVAESNLQRIFHSTFAISTRIGFDDMSLRQLSAECDISIGGIYACIGSKEDLTYMAGDCVRFIGEEFVAELRKIESTETRLRDAIKGGLYLSQLMSDWLEFLYSSISGQEGGEKAALTTLTETYTSIIAELLSAPGDTLSSGAADKWKLGWQARNITLLIGDWVLHKERYLSTGITVDDYADALLQVHCIDFFARTSDTKKQSPIADVIY